MGETRDQAICAARPEDCVGLYFPCNLSGRRKRRGARPASCDSEAMALHLAEISIAVAPGAHAILLLDQAGWHVSKKLPIPDNITLLPFPPKSPELNPIENISNRIFKSHASLGQEQHCLRCFYPVGLGGYRQIAIAYLRPLDRV